MNPFAGLIRQILDDPTPGTLPKPVKGKAIYRPVIVYDALKRPISSYDVAARYCISASTASNNLVEAGRAGLMRLHQKSRGGKPALWVKQEGDK